MLLRHIALLDRFDSDTHELDLSYEDRTLKIRKILRKELEDFLLPTKLPSISAGTFERAISIGENGYWLEYFFML